MKEPDDGQSGGENSVRIQTGSMWARVLSGALVGLFVFLTLYDSATLYIAFFFERDFFTHAVAFSALSVAVMLGWRDLRLSVGGLVLFAAGVEAAQALSPSREVAAIDMAGNVLGILVALPIVWLVRSRRARLTSVHEKRRET